MTDVRVNLIVVCGFVGCTWTREIDPATGADPITVHNEYLDHLDTHDPDVDPDCDCEETAKGADLLAEHDPAIAAAVGWEGLRGDRAMDRTAALIDDLAAADLGLGLYAGDTPEQIAAGQARIDRFMAGGDDR